MGRLLDLFCPDQCASTIAQIDLAALRAGGFEALMLDLDNTLIPWQSTDIPDSSRCWIDQAKQLGIRLCIVSNTHNPKRLQRIATDLGLPWLHGALKPRRGAFSRAAGVIDADPQRTAVVGDQVLTDILGGNLAGMHTILVKPMHRREFIGTKISRLVERVILALLRRKGRLGTNFEASQSDKRYTR